MAHELVFRPAAVADLDAIDDYIAQESPARAAQVISRIRARCEQLRDFPELGPSRDDLRSGIRLLAVERWAVIVYRIDGERIEIGRIFYGGRDYATLLAAQD